MVPDIVDTVKDKAESARRTAKLAWHLRQYVKGKKTRDDLIQFKGHHMWLAGGYDVIPFPTNAWGHVIKSMMDLQGPASVAGIKEGYRNVGKEDAQQAKKIFKTKDLGQLFKFWIDLGYANVIKIEVQDADGNTRESSLVDVGKDLQDRPAAWIATVTDNFSIRALNEINASSDFPICIFGPYYSAGFLSTWFDVDCTVTEPECQGKGDDLCRWVFEFDWESKENA